MALQYWDKKLCKNCGHVSASALPKYTCDECSTIGCPECMTNGALIGDGDGNCKSCVKCAWSRLPQIMGM